MTKAPGPAIRYIPLAQSKARHAVAVARDQLTTDGVGCGAEAIELGFEEPVRMVEGLWAPGWIDQEQHAGVRHPAFPSGVSSDLLRVRPLPVLRCEAVPFATHAV